MKLLTTDSVLAWAGRQEKLHPGLVLAIAGLGFIAADLYAGFQMRDAHAPTLGDEQQRREVRGLLEGIEISALPPSGAVAAADPNPSGIGWHPVHAIGFAHYECFRTPAHLVVAWISQEHPTEPFHVFFCDGKHKETTLVLGSIANARTAANALTAKYGAA